MTPTQKKSSGFQYAGHMAERYDTVAAAHYAAYRPPLHELILDKALGGDARFALGVDVGCGTGRSTIALATYCDRTVGIDPSDSMLNQAEPHAHVSYLVGAGDSIPVPDASADVITFAGSLHYADSTMTRREVRRVGTPGATILVYDFDLQLTPVLTRLGMALPESRSDYNHTANFTGGEGFVERNVTSETINIRMTTGDFAHVVLSDSNRLDYLTSMFGPDTAYSALVSAINAADETVAVNAALFISMYTLAPHDRSDDLHLP